MIHRFGLSIVFGWSLCSVASIQAAVASLAPSADVRILDFFPDSNLNSESILSVYTQPGNVQRTLLRFDLGSIPLNQQIDSAVLTIHPNPTFGDNSNGLNMDVHAVTKTWIETQATWNSASTGELWATPGGDFDPFVYATSTSISNLSPVDWDVTSLVQDWYDGSRLNFGMLIRSFPGNSLHFYSNESTTLALRPSLTVTYSVPEANTLLMVGIGIVSWVIVAGCVRAMRSR